MAMSEYGFHIVPPQPSSDDCTKNTITVIGGRRYMACWYPQMGGYGATCMVELPAEPGGCFEAFVWHDGTFPFDSKDVMTDSFGDGTVRTPAHIHHCSAVQFRAFADTIDRAGRA
jgi:hypothetical protein